MATFESTKFVPVVLNDYGPIAQDVMQVFKAQGYDVSGKPTEARGWLISISKGGAFKAVLGLRTALNIDIQPAIGGTVVKAGVGIFGQQAIPAMITLFFLWPVILTQAWGMIEQSNLDDEAVAQVESLLLARPSSPAGQPAATT